MTNGEKAGGKGGCGGDGGEGRIKSEIWAMCVRFFMLSIYYRKNEIKTARYYCYGGQKSDKLHKYTHTNRTK